MDSTKPCIRRFSVSDIQAFVKLAVDNNLSLLEIADVKIIPSARRNSEPSEPLTLLKEAERKAGRKLTGPEIEDEILFGPGGSLRVSDDQ